MKRNIIFLLSLLMLGSTVVRANEPVRFTASAPSTVILDKPFQLVYTVNANGRELRAPEIKNFDVLAGPFQSSSSSISIINGRQTSEESNSFTYTLQAQKTGTFSIPSASIIVNGKKYMSNGISIKVLPADATPPEDKQKRRNGGNAQSISSDNIFIKAEVSKTNVFEQEAVLVTYKLYTLMDVVQCANRKMPDFNGFLKQDIELSQNKQFSYENYNGHNYGTVVLYKVLLYPQHSGTIEIGKAVFDAVIRMQNKTQIRSIFDDFFDSYTNVTKSITAPAVRISVQPLPGNKPASFSGTVGHFNMSAKISATQMKANDAVTLKLNISGTGNLKLVKTPEIKFPDGFEKYDPKVSNNFKTTPSGFTGSKSIEYMFIPRHSGRFEIPSVEFSYFDTQTKNYKVIRTPVYNLTVAKGDGNESTVVGTSFVDKEDVKQLGRDVRYIVTDNFELTKDEEPLFGTTTCWIMFLIPLLISLALFVFFRKQVIENANVNLVRNKKANKVARKRLKLAQKLLKDGNKDKFYDEVLKAVWNYLSDKLFIPVASLTKERVEEELLARQTDPAVISSFIDILNTCEYARYAPNSGQQEMGNLYDETVDVISRLEELKKM